MITLSRRYAAIVAILCLVAALPIYLHSSGRLTRDDCAHPAALRATLPIAGTRATPSADGLPRGMIQRSEGTIEWSVKDDPLRFAIRRTYQPVHLLNPPQRIADSFEAGTQEVRRIPQEDGEVPIHWAVDRTRAKLQFSAYMVVFRGKPRQQPLLSLFGSSLAQITGGARPFTLFVVGGTIPRGRLDEARRASEDWLVAAWHHYDAVCNPEPPAAE